MPYKNKEDAKRNSRKKYENNKQAYILKATKFRKKFRQENPKEYLIRHTKYSSKLRGLEFNIKVSDIKWVEYCPILGHKLEFSDGTRKKNAYSLDRLDNTKGYIPGNVFAISWEANHLKTRLTTYQIEKLLEYLKSNNKEVSS